MPPGRQSDPFSAPTGDRVLPYGSRLSGWKSRALLPTPALCPLITCMWNWVGLPVTHRQRAEGPGEQERTLKASLPKGRDVAR